MMLLCDVLRIKNKEVRAKDKRIIATVAPVARTNNIMRGVIAAVGENDGITIIAM